MLEEFLQAPFLYSPSPRKNLRLGNFRIEAHEIEPGQLFITTTGGSATDREILFPPFLEQLREGGYTVLTWDIPEEDEILKEANDAQPGWPGWSGDYLTWPGVMQKAKRLLDSGAVQVLRNGYNNVVSQVQGDHGNYEVEFMRDDPSSRALTQIHCECNHPDNQVAMADGSLKYVKDIQTGDLVLTASGHVGIVGRTMQREYDGRMMGLKIEGSTETVWLTETHRLITHDLQWKLAGDWKTGDFSYMPAPQYVEQDSINLRSVFPELIEVDGWLHKPNKHFHTTKHSSVTTLAHKTVTPIPAQINLDQRFARLAGFFVAEGTVTKGEIRFAFGEHEKGLVTEVIDILASYGLKTHVRTRRSCTVVSACSRRWAELFRTLFGTGARTKKLTLPIMTMPLLSLRAFMNAWVEGDGNINSWRTMIATASDDLAFQARWILARLGHESVIRKTEKNTSPLVPNGGSINTVTWRTNGGKGRGVRWYDDQQVFQRMIVEERHYKGTVYNFEVIDEHTYVLAPGIASANCPWMQWANQPRMRQFKKFQMRPCAHSLAAYWASLGTPLDDDTPDDYSPTPGQMGPQPSGGGAPEYQGEMPDQPAQAPPSPVIPQQEPLPPYQPGSSPAGFAAPPNAVSVPGARPPTPQNPLNWPSAYSKVAADLPQYQNGSVIQLNNPTYGILEGPPNHPDTGTYREIPQNSHGEVIDHDPDSGLMSAIFPLHDTGAGEPWMAKMYVHESEVRPSFMKPPGTFIRRTR